MNWFWLKVNITIFTLYGSHLEQSNTVWDMPRFEPSTGRSVSSWQCTPAMKVSCPAWTRQSRDTGAEPAHNSINSSSISIPASVKQHGCSTHMELPELYPSGLCVRHHGDRHVWGAGVPPWDGFLLQHRTSRETPGSPASLQHRTQSDQVCPGTAHHRYVLLLLLWSADLMVSTGGFFI